MTKLILFIKIETDKIMRDLNKKNIDGILNELDRDILALDSLEELKNIQRKYLGKKEGIIKKLISGIGNLREKEKKELAPLIQKAQKTAVKLFEEKEKELEKSGSKQELKKQAEDIGYKTPKIGHLHPITQTVREMNKIFISLGFSIADGPEIEEDEYCFRRLNVPLDHPARDMQDTLYIQEPNFLLRTQTSSIEARVLEKYRPPLKVVSPGRVYRNEKVNKSNHFIFHHYQGFVVLEKTSLKDLFGIFTALFKKMYGSDVTMRYRNKYYPEVEPGVGLDMRCFRCKGRGCSLCKGVGWIEMGGAGIIHPNVMKMAGIDNRKWMGFAFGLGLDRWVMARYKITDIRTLLGGNLGYKYYENENTL
ncbi:MAG: phenylalanine--tRNA ligase subunit alpha [Patescibacteria group bacterium]|nr:phenylalanine--tRNA ligase subunit alpha [Patescibacteria group bacterium]